MKKNKKFFKLFVKPIIMSFLGIICLLTAYNIYQMPKMILKNNLASSTETILNLASESASNYFAGIRNEITLLAKKSEIYKIRKSGFVKKILEEYKENTDVFAASLEVEISLLFNYISDWNETFDYLKDLPKASERLVYKILSFYDEDSFLDGTPEEVESFYSSGAAFDYKSVFGIIEFIKETSGFIFNLSEVFAEFVDKFVFLSKSLPHNSDLTNRVLAMGVDNGSIKSLIIKDKTGEEVASYNIDSVICNSDKDIKHIMKGFSFFGGEVCYNKKGDPFYWTAVPLRDEERETVGCLTAFADMSFLSETANRNNEFFEITYLDKNGIIVGSADKTKVKNQVNGFDYYGLNKNEPTVFCQKIIKNKEGQKVFQNSTALKTNQGTYAPNLFVVVETYLFKYLNDFYYTCILTVIILSSVGIYFLSVAGLGWLGLVCRETGVYGL